MDRREGRAGRRPREPPDGRTRGGRPHLRRQGGDGLQRPRPPGHRGEADPAEGERPTRSAPPSPAAEAKGAHFVKPELVGEVAFGEWTPAGRLRHPKWKGLRPDKDPDDVTRESEVDQTDMDEPPSGAVVPSPSAPGGRSRSGGSSQPVHVQVGGRELPVTNLDKVLFPQTGFTKGQLIDYYARIAPVMLPHVADRPLTMKRYPDGVEGKFFFEKHVPSHAPRWVKTVSVPSERDTTDRLRAGRRPGHAGLGRQSGDDRVPRAAVAGRPQAHPAGPPRPHGVRPRPRRGDVHRRMLRRRQPGRGCLARTEGGGLRQDEWHEGTAALLPRQAAPDVGVVARRTRTASRCSSSPSTASSSCRRCARTCAAGACSSTGARMWRPRRRSACTRCEPLPFRRSRRP